MSRLKKLQKDSVLYFMGAYLLVLCLPLLIFMLGILAVYRNMEAEVDNSNIVKMEHSVQLINSSLDALRSMAVQGASSATVKKIAASEQINQIEYKDEIDELSTTMAYLEQSVGFVKEYYLYFNKSKYSFYRETFYKETLFDLYLKQWNLEKEVWQEKIVSQELRSPEFVTYNGVLHYVMPIYVNSFIQSNSGVLVCILDTESLLSYFDFMKEIGEGIIYVVDANGNILFSNDINYTAVEGQEKGFDDICKEYDSYKLMECCSKSAEWNYYYWITDSTAGGDSVQFLKMALLATVVIFIGCIYISLFQARRQGRPINQMFELVAPKSEDAVIYKQTPEKLGEIVAGIVSKNQEMQQEIRESKPFLRKAFFHDLLTLDVTSSKELEYLAENAGINIKSDEFWVISVRLFSNNDVYDVDEQTLEDVKVIIRSMQKYIEEILGQDVWFYQRKYLSMLILIDGKSKQQIWNMVENVYSWLLNIFATESTWGISTKCTNIMNMWKHFEEAEMARKYCNTKQRIVEYSSKISDNQAFYFPEAAEEKFINYMNSGDLKAIRDTLSILEHENLINRMLSRNGFIKLNNKICEMLSANLGEQKSMEYIMKLNNMIIGNEKIKGGQYFSVLDKVFADICAESKQITGKRRNELAENIQDYIEMNYANPELGLANISVVFGISEGYVSSLFKKQTQIGFNEYVEKIRMSKAIDLLKEDSEKRNSIEVIAEKVGYNSVQSFRRAFKRIYGVSPKNYR